MALTKEDLKHIERIVETKIVDSEMIIKSDIQGLRLDLEKGLKGLEEKIDRFWKALNEDLLAEHKMILELKHQVKVFGRRLTQLEGR